MMKINSFYICREIINKFYFKFTINKVKIKVLIMSSDIII